MLFRVRGEERERLDVVVDVGSDDYFDAVNIEKRGNGYAVLGLPGTADKENIENLTGERLSLDELKQAMGIYYQEKMSADGLPRNISSLLEKYSKKKDRELR